MNLKPAILAAAIGLAGSFGAQAAEKDIVDTAVAAGQFQTLAAALEAAGLVATLKGEGPFTVFAPTDEAFAKLPSGTVETLLKEENKDQLTAILTYHVVPGKVMSQDVAGIDEARTVNGKMIDFEVDGSAVKVNDATVTQADIAAANGVNITDGLDGLSGGTLAIAFVAYMLIALLNFPLAQPNLALLCALIIGALLGFLWFNVHPAQIFIGDSGALSLGATLLLAREYWRAWRGYYVRPGHEPATPSLPFGPQQKEAAHVRGNTPHA